VEERKESVHKEKRGAGGRIKQSTRKRRERRGEEKERASKTRRGRSQSFHVSWRIHDKNK